MRIKVERSGGLAGIPISNEMDEKDLPSEVIRTAQKIKDSKTITSQSVKSSAKGAADHYHYKILIDDGLEQRIIKCTQYEIQGDLKSLVKYIEKNSKKR